MNQINEVATAVVVDMNDPTGQRRIRVKFAQQMSVAEEWARVASSPAGPRLARLAFEVNDDVLVAFEEGDQKRPFVVGVLWDGRPSPQIARAVRTIHLPTGSVLRALTEIDEASPDCAMTSNLLQQIATWLASTECLFKIFALVKPLVKIIEQLPTPRPASLQEFAAAAATLPPCLLIDTPAMALPLVRDLLCLSLQSLQCLLDHPVTQIEQSNTVAGIQEVLDLARPFFDAVGVQPVQLSALADASSLQEDINAIQVVADALGGCGA